MPNNPYAQATGAYGAAHATDQRGLEGMVLLKAASNLEDISRRIANGEKPSLEEIGNVLTNNRKVWQIFLDNAMSTDNAMPIDLRNNIASLAVFVFKRTQELMIDTKAEKFAVLININRNIASGLMKQRPASTATAGLPHADKHASAMTTDSMA